MLPSGRRHRAHRPHEARRRAFVGLVGGVLHAHQVGDGGARVLGRLGDGLRDAHRAAGGAVGIDQHLLGHAVQAVGVVDAAHLDQRQVLRGQRGVDHGGLDHVGLGPHLDGHRVHVHEARRRRGHVQPLLLGRIEHVDRVVRRHVVLDRRVVALVDGHRLVFQRGQFLGGERGAGHDAAVLGHLAGAEGDQQAVGAVPQRVGRGHAAVGADAALVVDLGGGDLRLPAFGGDRAVGRGVVFAVVGGVDQHQRTAFLGARQRHQGAGEEALVGALRVHVARVQEAVAGALRAVEHEHVGAVGLAAEDGEAVAVAHVLPAAEHDVAVGPHHRVAVMALVEADLLDRAAGGVHGVQVQHALAFVLVQRVVGAAVDLVGLALGLAVGREDDAAAGRQVGGVDVVVGAAAGQAAERALRQARRHVVFPQVPAPGAGRLAVDRGGVGGGAAQREDHLLAVVADLGVGHVALALGDAVGEVVLGGAGRRFLAQHQVAAGRERRAVGRVHRQRGRALGVDQRHVAVDGDRVGVAAAARAARSHDRSRRQRGGEVQTIHPNAPA